jgi:hypothetical protein
MFKVAKRKEQFSCAVKDDFIRNGTYRYGSCVSNNVNECTMQPVSEKEEKYS